MHSTTNGEVGLCSWPKVPTHVYEAEGPDEEVEDESASKRRNGQSKHLDLSW